MLLRNTTRLSREVGVRFFSTSTSNKFAYSPETVKTLGTSPMKQIPHRQVLSGIQPTGSIHLGNYLGALVNWKFMQDTEFSYIHQNVIDFILSSYDYHFNAAKLLGQTVEQAKQHACEASIEALSRAITFSGDSPDRFNQSKILFSVVDLHAITVPQVPHELRQNCENIMTLLLAMGLDPQQSNLFFQSHCQYHAELNWLLTSVTPISWLYRMTQFKDKAQKMSSGAIGAADGNDAGSNSKNDEGLLRGVNTGLLAYPILMSADILVYNATHIPVGDDQLQHLELAREMARSWNSQFSLKSKRQSKTSKANAHSTSSFAFSMPEAILNKDATRVMSLRVPTSKMSKSDPSEASRIHLSDSNDQISQKIRRATTDSEVGISYNSAERPGVSNLLDMLSAVTNLKERRNFSATVLSTLKSHQVYSIISGSSTPLNALKSQLSSSVDFVDQLREYREILMKLQQEDFPGRVSSASFADSYAQKNMSALKQDVADALITEISPIRTQYEELSKDKSYLQSTMKQGAQAARRIASPNMKQIYELMGYTPSDVYFE